MTKNSETLFKKGVEYLRNGNFNEAENCFEELKNTHPTNKDILNNPMYPPICPASLIIVIK